MKGSTHRPSPRHAQSQNSHRLDARPRSWINIAVCDILFGILLLVAESRHDENCADEEIETPIKIENWDIL